MKRFAIKLVLFLLAGAVINVAVAWLPYSKPLNDEYKTDIGGDVTWICHWQSGWPTRSMQRSTGNVCDETGILERRHSLVILEQTVRGGVSFPLLPLWPGFAINTIFYAAVLWVLFAVPGKVRRWRRIKRGQCASCGYSLCGTSHIEKCPECGATA